MKMDRSGNAIPAGRPYTVQNLAVGAGSVASAAFTNILLRQHDLGSTGAVTFNQTTGNVRLVSTTDCWVAFGATPVATAGAAGDTNSVFLPAGASEYFAVNAGEKVAVIQASAAGVLNIAELVQ